MSHRRHWTRREFLITAGATAAGAALFSLDINGNCSPSAFSQEALAVEPIIDPKTLEKPNLPVGYVPVNDCAPFAIAWKKGFFRKYGLNVKLSAVPPSSQPRSHSSRTTLSRVARAGVGFSLSSV